MPRMIRFFLISLGLVMMPVVAHANHSFSLVDIRVCLNGAQFTGISIGGGSADLPMTAQIFDESFNLLFTGSVAAVEANGSEVFTVSYPVGSFELGDNLFVSASDIPGTLNGAEGDFKYGSVQACEITQAVLDSRINRFDASAPVAVYPNSSGGVDIYLISNSVGTLVLSVSAADFEAPANSAGNVIAASQDGIVVARLADGSYQVNAPAADGKTYYLYFDAISSSASYRHETR